MIGEDLKITFKYLPESEGVNTACNKCEAGKFKAAAGVNTACDNCPAGKYSTVPGATSIDTCVDCVAGKYSALMLFQDSHAVGASVCTDCAAGKYVNATGATACLQCATNATSTADGRSCACLPGFEGDGRVYCSACAAGKARGLLTDGAACTASACTTNPPETSRTYSSVFGNDAIGTGHARSMLDSPQAWSAADNAAAIDPPENPVFCTWLPIAAARIHRVRVEGNTLGASCCRTCRCRCVRLDLWLLVAADHASLLARATRVSAPARHAPRRAPAAAPRPPRAAARLPARPCGARPRELIICHIIHIIFLHFCSPTSYI